MILSDNEILRAIREKKIVIKPFEKKNVQSATVDLRLGNYFRVFNHETTTFIDSRHIGEYTETVKVKKGAKFVIHPGEFALGVVLESVKVPRDLIARIDGRSSLGRLGLIVHATAGFVNPGWDGHLTLELSNVGKLPIALYPGMRVAQISFMQLTSPAKNAYGSKKLGSKYKGKEIPEESKIQKEF